MGRLLAVRFAVVDATTGAPICDATVDPPGASYGYIGTDGADANAMDGGPCTYVAGLDNDGHHSFTVSRAGYVAQTFDFPVDQCGMPDMSSAPKTVALKRI